MTRHTLTAEEAARGRRAAQERKRRDLLIARNAKRQRLDRLRGELPDLEASYHAALKDPDLDGLEDAGNRLRATIQTVTRLELELKDGDR